MDLQRWVERVVGSRLLTLHDTIYQKTDGRIGHKFPGIPPTLLLHTTGAKTGLPRTNSLTYAKDGDAYLIVASNAGSRAPGWYHNLKRDPKVEINVGTKRLPVIAKLFTPGDRDYDRLWEIVNANNFNAYKGYQKRTSRPIPVIALRARSA